MSSPGPMAATHPAGHKNHGLMHLLMLFVTICWASNIIAGKEALRRFDSLALAQLRVLGSAIIFTIAFLATGRFRCLRLSRRDWGFLLAIGATGIALNQLTFIGGMARTSVAHTGLIVALGPVLVLVIAVLIGLESLTASKLLGMLVAFSGVGILTLDKAGQGRGGHWLGDLLMLASITVFAVYTILMKEVANKFDPLTLNTLAFGLGGIMMLPFCSRAVAMTNWASIDSSAWEGLAFLVVFGSVISYSLFAYVMTELAASRVAAFNYLQPVIASALGIWVLAERLTPKVLVGGALILAGVYLTERERGEESVPAAATDA